MNDQEKFILAKGFRNMEYSWCTRPLERGVYTHETGYMKTRRWLIAAFSVHVPGVMGGRSNAPDEVSSISEKKFGPSRPPVSF